MLLIDGDLFRSVHSDHWWTVFSLSTLTQSRRGSSVFVVLEHSNMAKRTPKQMEVRLLESESSTLESKLNHGGTRLSFRTFGNQLISVE